MTWQFSNYLELLWLKRWCHHPFAQHHRPPDFISQPRGSFKHSTQPKSSGQERRSPPWLLLASHIPGSRTLTEPWQRAAFIRCNIIHRTEQWVYWLDIEVHICDVNGWSPTVVLSSASCALSPLCTSMEILEGARANNPINLFGGSCNDIYMLLLLSSSLCLLIFNHSFIWVHLRYSSLTPRQQSVCLLHQTHLIVKIISQVWCRRLLWRPCPFPDGRKFLLSNLGANNNLQPLLHFGDTLLKLFFSKILQIN